MLSVKNFQQFYFEKAYKIYFYTFLIFLFGQFGFWYKTENLKPEFEIVSAPPSKYIIPILSLGDDEFLFRALAYKLQNSGDVFAGFVSLKKYNYKNLYDWFTTLDTLNSESNFVPALASYYYASTPNYQDTVHIVNYLEEHSMKDLDKNWWWMFQATVIANRELKDQNRSIELAYKMSKTKAKNAPIWVAQYPAFLLAKKGEACASFKVIEEIFKENQQGTRKINAGEMDFMRHFIADRLGKLKKDGFDPRKCKNVNL